VVLKGLHNTVLLEHEFGFRVNILVTRCHKSSLTETKVHLFLQESVQAG